MKYHVHPNGWTAFADIDLSIAPTHEIYELANLCSKHIVVKVPNQHLTINREVEIVKSFKKVYRLVLPGHERFERYSLDPEGFVGKVSAGAIAGHKEEMSWHNEMPSVRHGSDIAWLYAETGVKGSVTVWNNTAVAYRDLPDSTKHSIKDLKCIHFGNVNHSVNRTELGFSKRTIYEDTPIPLVYVNHSGQIGLHLSLHQFEKFQGMSREESLKIAEPLFEFITQDKYCYFHQWHDGDVSISDQWLSVHKRLHFEDMRDRIVHRATFNYIDSI